MCASAAWLQASGTTHGTTRAMLAAMTGYSQVEDRSESRRAGFDMHLTKPVELEDLQKVLAASPGQADDDATGRPGT
jgi:CheY-like chemotaxis protein